MKQKREYSVPDILIVGLNWQDVLTASGDAYDVDNFDPLGSLGSRGTDSVLIGG